MPYREPEPIQVHTYSGYKADERPALLVVEGRQLQVVEIIDRWHQTGVKPGQGIRTYFRVKADDGRVYSIFQNQRSGHWFLEQGEEGTIP